MKVVKVRVSKKLDKTLGKEVAQKVRDVAGRYNVHTATIEYVPHTHVFQTDEGDKMTGGKYVNGHYEWASVEVVAEHNLGARGLSHAIGRKFQLPVMSVLITVYYYTRFFMTVQLVGWQ